MSSRRMMDLVIQRSAVELFASIGIAIAPMPAVVANPRLGADDFVGIVQLSVNGARGSLAVAASLSTLSKAKGAVAAPSMQDWLRELVNQLAGRIKNRLARYQVSVDVSLPSALARSAFDRGFEIKGNTTVYAFRTIRDDIQVMLTGELGNIDLRFSGAEGVAEEGELILF
jgi:hypothetical protein